MARTVIIKDAQTGVVTERDMTPDEEAALIPTSAELDALAEILATEVAESDAKFKVLARLIFELAKAQKTGDLSFFDSVTDAATYKALLVSMFRANL